MSMSDSSIVDLEKMLPSSGSAHAVAGVPEAIPLLVSQMDWIYPAGNQHMEVLLLKWTNLC